MLNPFNPQRWTPVLVSLLLSALCLWGCSSTAVNAQNSAADFADLSRLDGVAQVQMTVNGSPIRIEVRGEAAPITAGNFIDLVKKGVYEGVAFHRVVRDPQPFVVQGGDPQSQDPNVPMSQLGTGGYIDPSSGERRFIPLEILPVGADTPVYSQTLPVGSTPVLAHKRGAVAMARSSFPDSASSQFYFALSDLPNLDGSYAVFGYVVGNGMAVVDQIQSGDRIEAIEVLD
ncbi:MAG: peptidylprolyl isomerase [Cyanobacteria bacterium P01_G01_bin.54]